MCTTHTQMQWSFNRFNSVWSSHTARRSLYLPGRDIAHTSATRNDILWTSAVKHNTPTGFPGD